MADERVSPHEGSPSGPQDGPTDGKPTDSASVDASPGRSAPDATSQMPAVTPEPGDALDATGPMPAVDPYVDDPAIGATAPRPTSADATQGRPSASDATQAMRAANDATQAIRATAGATQAIPAAGPSGTSVMPAVGAGAVGAAAVGGAAAAGADSAPRWAARAEVPAAGVGHPGPAGWQEEVHEDPYAGRSWFTPILLGVLALILLALLGVGVWLIYRSTWGNAPAPGDQVSAPAASVSAAPSTAPPTSAAASTAAPSSAAPAKVDIQDVQGMSRAAAEATLRGQGLEVRVVMRPDATAQAGTATGTDPAAGASVPPGSPVTLFIASAPPKPTAPASTAASASAAAASASASAH